MRKPYLIISVSLHARAEPPVVTSGNHTRCHTLPPCNKITALHTQTHYISLPLQVTHERNPSTSLPVDLAHTHYHLHFQFRFADWKDRLLIVVGILTSIATGTGLPLNLLLFGGMIDVFVDNDKVQALIAKIDWSTAPHTMDEALANPEFLG